jgi:hypothetical protein
VKGNEVAGGIVCRLRKETRSQVVWETQVLTPRGAWRRERLENSNFLLVRIPVAIHRLQRGQGLICMDGERLPEGLGLTDQEIERLSQAGLVRRQAPKTS